MSKWQLNGVAYEDLGWDLDEMSDLDGFIDWLTDCDDGAVWNEKEGYWEYPEDEDDDFEEVYEDLIMLDDEELIALRRCDVRFDEMLTELEEETDDEEIRRYLHITSYRYVSGDTECDEDLSW